MTTSSTSAGRLTLWQDPQKNVPFTTQALNGTSGTVVVYVEGAHESTSTNDQTLEVVYTVGGNAGVQKQTVHLTVTPVLNSLTVTPGSGRFQVPGQNVNFIAWAQNNAIPGWGGLMGVAADSRTDNIRPGAVFQQDVIDAGVTMNFLQDAVSIKNGASAGNAGWNFSAASGIPPYDQVAPGFPMLDTIAVGSPYASYAPFYHTGLAIPTTQQPSNVPGLPIDTFVDGDRPFTSFPTNVDLTATESVDLKYSFRLYSVVSYPDGSISAVGHTDWSVTFYATSVAGVPTIQIPNGVKAAGIFVRSSVDPWTAGGAGNDILASPGYGWQPSP